ncbi:MAG: DUF5395 family protein [Archaeoglobaceae archaeon]
MKIIVPLRFEGRWLLNFEGEEITADTLEELDRRFADVLKRRGFRGRVEVRYEFNMSSIPSWMRQFQQHYFNRVVTLQLD